MSPLLPICPVGDLPVGGAVTFEAHVRGERRPCVAVRRFTDGVAVAFVNVCAHRNQPVVVDGRPFDELGRIECRAHGAIYEANEGECVAGPCVGARLLLVPLVEQDGLVQAIEDDVVDDSAYAEG